MRARNVVIVTALILAVLGETAGAARKSGGISTFLLAWPGYEAQWQKGIGIPDGTKSQQGLLLEKVDAASTEPGSGATFSGVEGIALTELGYDIRSDGVCGVFPRFRVRVPAGSPDTTSDDYNYLFECQAGTHTPSSEGWTTVRFSELDARPDTFGAPPFVFGTEISTLGLLFHLDEGVGSTTLDNFDVSGTIIGKPGR